ncbi:MAG: AtpZ/AtpI family protein [Alphaproteobacteria bacterium]|nr:AtpZ/AtpI family protein [Alphaproteobacteria bacterium]
MADDFDDTAAKEICNTLIKKAQQLKTRRQQHWNANFGMIASLGGVIIVPIVLGVFCGGWLDEHFPADFSWRLSLLFLGFVWGLVNACYWIKNEEAKIEKNEQRTAESLKQGEKNGR